MKVRELVQKHNPFLDEKIYDDKTSKELVQQFRKKVVEFIRDNKNSRNFQGKLGNNPENYLSGMGNANTWGADVEIEAMSGLLNCKFLIFSNTNSRDVSFYSYRRDLEISQLKLFHDTTPAGGSRDGNYYNFGLDEEHR